MKKIIPFVLALFALSSCTKEAPLDAYNAAYAESNSFNLNVFVTVLEAPAAPDEVTIVEPATTNDCEPSGEESAVALPMENVEVYLLEGIAALEDFSSDKAMENSFTNGAGKAIIQDLPAGDYSIYVSTEFGATMRNIKVDGTTTNFVAVQFQEAL